MLSRLCGVPSCIVAKYNLRLSEWIPASSRPEFTRNILARTGLCFGTSILEVLSLAISVILQGKEADTLYKPSPWQAHHDVRSC